MSYQIKHNNYFHKIIAAIVIVILWGVTPLMAMPPNPDMLERKLKSGDPLPYFLKNHAQLTNQGINRAAKMTAPHKGAHSGPFKALAVLIKFPDDKEAPVAAQYFDTLIFTDRQGTIRNYYNQVSYGQLDIVTVNLPSSPGLGWVTAPQDYSYYCDGQNGIGSYPHNCQKLCEDIVDLINPSVDFSDYDNDGDGYVDALILVHSGQGAEYTGSNDDIWSHQWYTSSPRSKDGVYIWGYSIEPEYWAIQGDMTCGVFCHEFGHTLGLPDLYDTDDPRDAYGVGKWSLMGYGSWNGPGGLGGSPAHLDAWSRIYLGFTNYNNVTENSNNVSIDNVEESGSIYRLWSSGGIGNQYFLVENRQRTGYDSFLPSSGLLIWHIDETQSTNDDQWYPGHTGSGNYLVALEQADSLFELEKNLSVGNAGDPFPGNTANTIFSPLTAPNSNSYAGDNTYVSVSNISPSGSTMTADFQVSLVSDIEHPGDGLLPREIALGQNYPNPFNPSTNIEVYLPAGTNLTLAVYDILGRTVNTILDGYYSAGSIRAKWNGTDHNGQPLPSGVYFYELKTPHKIDVKKMLLIK
ncbi:MAG: M6 family metalloprotease domain-containing protein [candidate division Zixibacteria bacterium]|nr:M6 family metalloprotease domain-containing protein [candidate division Zixibacteria bacterium]